MNLRNLVPALGLVALTSAPALAADAMPAVSFEGWVDTIFTLSDDDSDDAADTAKDEESVTLRFSAQASVKANWKVTDALSARINLWFDPSSEEGDELNMREAYFAWALNDTVTWSMGKYIDHIGWIAAEPTGLYTVNASLVGYTDTYGNDVIGTSIAVAPKGSPFSGSFHVTNGYYTGVDASNAGPSVNRENTSLGFGLDLVYAFEDKASLNLEFAYDIDSETNSDGATPGDEGLGGDVFLVGFNATITPVKPLLIGAEIQYLTYGQGEDVDGADIGEDIDRLQGMILVNYAIEGAPVPMSISGMLQYVTIDSGLDEDETRIGGAVALLTNPLTSSNFGLNFEIGLYDISDEADTSGTPVTFADDNGFVFAVEGLVTF